MQFAGTDTVAHLHYMVLHTANDSGLHIIKPQPSIWSDTQRQVLDFVDNTPDIASQTKQQPYSMEWRLIIPSWYNHGLQLQP